MHCPSMYHLIPPALWYIHGWGIFEWDQQDFDMLLQAKRYVLISSGVINPSDPESHLT